MTVCAGVVGHGWCLYYLQGAVAQMSEAEAKDKGGGYGLVSLSEGTWNGMAFMIYIITHVPWEQNPDLDKARVSRERAGRMSRMRRRGG